MHPLLLLSSPVALAADVAFSGYVQAQYVSNEISEDEVTPDGKPKNLDRFLVRRARVTLRWERPHVAAWIEPDFNTTDGPWVSPNNAALSVFLPNPDPARPHYLGLTAGIFDLPFGAELPESSGSRPFAERSFGSRALFPGDHDVGAELAGGLGPVRYVAAVVNGVPLQNTPGDTYVFTRDKTFLGRVGVDAGAAEAWSFVGGVSLLSGTGFSEGTPSTKSDLGWSDENQNGTVTLDELVGIQSQAAVASETFLTWAVNADLSIAFHTPLGWTRVYGEATMAQNLDRGFLVADPISTGYDLRELAWSAAAVQDVTRYAAVGFRADWYDGNSDAFETRRGDFLPLDLSVLTLSPLVQARWPEAATLSFQYDYVVDHLGRDALGEPADAPNDQWTVRAQVEF